MVQSNFRSKGLGYIDIVVEGRGGIEGHFGFKEVFEREIRVGVVVDAAGVLWKMGGEAVP